MRALIVLLLLRATAFACDLSEVPSHFEIFDRSDFVVAGTPTTMNASSVTLAVDTVLKGKPGATVTVRLGMGDCDPHFVKDTRVVVFVRDGRPTHAYRSVVAPSAAQPWLERLRQWAATSSDAARVGVVAATIASGGELAITGVLALREDAALVRALSTANIVTIANAWPKLHGGLRGMLLELDHADLRTALRAKQARR